MGRVTALCMNKLIRQWPHILAHQSALDALDGQLCALAAIAYANNIHSALLNLFQIPWFHHDHYVNQVSYCPLPWMETITPECRQAKYWFWTVELLIQNHQPMRVLTQENTIVPVGCCRQADFSLPNDVGDDLKSQKMGVVSSFWWLECLFPSLSVWLFSGLLYNN